jgi:hypothetical protein
MLKRVIFLLCITAIAAVALTFSRSAGRVDFARVEWIVIALAVWAAVARWRFVVRRRQKQKLEEMRDSALW